MPPSNRARQYGGGRGGGFDLGGLLLGAFGNGGAEELNPMFGQDEESWRADTGDYKSKFDDKNPYKRGNWANRMLGGDGSSKNAEFQVQQKVMQQQQQFQQDLEKLRLAIDLTKLGAHTEAEKLLKTVDFDNAKSLLQDEYQRKKGQAELESGLRTGEIKTKGTEDRTTDTNRFDLEDRNNLNTATRGFNAKLGMFPNTKTTDQMRELGSKAGIANLLVAPRLAEAGAKAAENKALALEFRDLGPSGTMRITDPALPVTYFDKGRDASLGQPAIPSQITRQNTQLLPPTPSAEPTLDTPVSPDLSNPPAVTSRGSGGRMTITPKPTEGSGIQFSSSNSDSIPQFDKYGNPIVNKKKKEPDYSDIPLRVRLFGY